MSLNAKTLAVLERAASVETEARGMDVHFEYIEDGIKMVFPEIILRNLISLFSVTDAEQDVILSKLDHRTLLILAELDGERL
jgi:hypothetical protein